MKAIKEMSLAFGLLALRLGFGLLLARHGYGKVFGGHIDQMVAGVAALGFPLPLYFAWAAALSEFAGGLMVVLGIATRVAASFIAVTMAVAFFGAHAADSFQVKELAFAYLVVAGSLILTGPGAICLDRIITDRKKG